MCTQSFKMVQVGLLSWYKRQKFNNNHSPESFSFIYLFIYLFIFQAIRPVRIEVEQSKLGYSRYWSSSCYVLFCIHIVSCKETDIK